MDTKQLIKLGSIAAAISSIAGMAYAGGSWLDERYAKTETVMQYQVETCKKLEELSLRNLQNEIFKLEIKAAEARRMPRDNRALANTPGNQWFSTVDEALLKRYKAEERIAQDKIRQCEVKK